MGGHGFLRDKVIRLDFLGGAMNEREMKQLFAELIEAQGVALGLVVAAIAKQLDAERLACDLGELLTEAKNQRAYSVVAGLIATHALDAALAVSRRRQETH
jgi:hypothetical protein